MQKWQLVLSARTTVALWCFQSMPFKGSCCPWNCDAVTSVVPVGVIVFSCHRDSVDPVTTTAAIMTDR